MLITWGLSSFRFQLFTSIFCKGLFVNLPSPPLLHMFLHHSLCYLLPAALLYVHFMLYPFFSQRYLLNRDKAEKCLEKEQRALLDVCTCHLCHSSRLCNFCTQFLSFLTNMCHLGHNSLFETSVLLCLNQCFKYLQCSIV